VSSRICRVGTWLNEVCGSGGRMRSRRIPVRSRALGLIGLRRGQSHRPPRSRPGRGNHFEIPGSGAAGGLVRVAQRRPQTVRNLSTPLLTGMRASTAAGEPHSVTSHRTMIRSVYRSAGI
jgi:hypothetical protein